MRASSTALPYPSAGAESNTVPDTDWASQLHVQRLGCLGSLLRHVCS